MDPAVLHLREMVRERLQDYAAQDFEAQRRQLVELWRAAHPDAAAEPPSRRHRPLDLLDPGVDGDNNRPQEWANDIYHVTVRRRPDDPVFGTNAGMIQLGISALDGTARHDWREFQGIKNQLCGEECEAFELYPAESRLLDPSNYYTLWCFPGLKRIKIGMNFRRVWDADHAMAPQRGMEE